MIQNTQKELLKWYKINGRHELAWRNTNNLYHIYLSEVMLQQTQVKRVKEEYYPQFLQKFPTLQTLAHARQDEVLSAWSGLGYYSRARNLHATAKLLKNTMPQEYKELLKLPGIGEYTASAICSFGLNQSITVVDTNIQRVLKRFFALLEPTRKELLEYAQKLLNTQEPRSHNLALMDLGSLICLVKNPKCELCPLKKECQGKEEAMLYTQKKKVLYESLELYYAIFMKEGKIALVHSKERLYKDMLVLPSIDPIEEDFLGEFKHSYTKYTLRVKLYKTENLQGNFIWMKPEELQNAPVSSLTKKAQKFF